MRLRAPSLPMNDPKAKLLQARDEAGHRLDRFFSAGRVRSGVRSLALAMSAHHAGRAAGAMAFDLFLAMIPLLALAGWGLGVVVHRRPAAIDSVTLLLSLTPTDVQSVLKQQLGRYADSAAVAPLAAFGALWLTSSAFHTVMNVFEGALRAAKRPWWHKRALSLACAALLVAAVPLIAWLAVSIAGGPVAILEAILGNQTESLRLARAVAIGVTVVGMTAFLAVFFRVAVVRPGIKRRVWPGAITAVFIGGMASWGFTAYVKELSRFTLFYGSLATVAVLMLWLWLCCAALLLGGEVNAHLEGVPRSAGNTARPEAGTDNTARPEAGTDDVANPPPPAGSAASGADEPERLAFDTLCFVAVDAEEKAVKRVAKAMGLKPKKKLGVFATYLDLGVIGVRRVAVVRTQMGPFGSSGSAAMAIRCRVECQATSLVGLGMAFGAMPTNQELGHVLISTCLLPYDFRKVICGVGGITTNDYSTVQKFNAKRDLLEMLQRFHAQAAEWRGKAHFGGMLTGSGRVHSTEFRNELARALGDRFGLVVGGEMEGGGLLGADSPENPTWIVVKGISDFADEARHLVITSARGPACERAVKFFLEALQWEARMTGTLDGTS